MNVERAGERTSRTLAIGCTDADQEESLSQANGHVCSRPVIACAAACLVTSYEVLRSDNEMLRLSPA